MACQMPQIQASRLRRLYIPRLSDRRFWCGMCAIKLFKRAEPLAQQKRKKINENLFEGSKKSTCLPGVEIDSENGS